MLYNFKNIYTENIQIWQRKNYSLERRGNFNLFESSANYLLFEFIQRACVVFVKSLDAYIKYFPSKETLGK